MNRSAKGNYIQVKNCTDITLDDLHHEHNCEGPCYPNTEASGHLGKFINSWLLKSNNLNKLFHLDENKDEDGPEFLRSCGITSCIKRLAHCGGQDGDSMDVKCQCCELMSCIPKLTKGERVLTNGQGLKPLHEEDKSIINLSQVTVYFTATFDFLYDH